MFVGLPIEKEQKLYNAAAVLKRFYKLFPVSILPDQIIACRKIYDHIRSRKRMAGTWRVHKRAVYDGNSLCGS